VPAKPFLGIRFECCRTYGRIYKNRDGTAYEGRCPSCGMKVRVRIASHGTDRRFFLAYPRSDARR
jgi:hypothetical protein